MDSTTSLIRMQGTRLWKDAFGQDAPYHQDIRAYYSTHLLDLREKTEALVGQIKIDLPQLTIHDMSHLDELWTLGSILAGDKHCFNPAEAFVFGASVLLHDAAMSLAAYPNGLADVRASLEWKDVVTMAMRARERKIPTADEVANPPADIFEMTLPQVLRLLHARQAEQLPKLIWGKGQGKQSLIDNAILNKFYGSLIGKIARSHGEPFSYIEEALVGTVGPLPSHDGGPVNGVKIALLLRCADAIHTDAKRAPKFQQLITNPSGVSGQHWTFQGKLAQARLEAGEIVISSGEPFMLDEAEAWWLCFDVVRAADREIRESNAFFDVYGVNPLAAGRVRGADSPQILARDVKTDGWHPVDAPVKISDVRHVIEMFGGKRLYGNDQSVVIRELIQNAVDAIRARRRRQMPNLAYDGEILIGLRTSDDKWWLDVVDSGVGMSARTMTDTLLDFGKSFWSSEAVQREFPGLMGNGMQPSGKFGIGFFSVFMIADGVSVTSRRHDLAQQSTRTLEFRDGLNLRPILREATSEEMLPEGGTRVSLKLKSHPYEKDGLLFSGQAPWATSKLKLSEVVASICPNLDVSVFAVSSNGKLEIVHRDDWLAISGAKLLGRIHRGESQYSPKTFGKMLRPIQEDGIIYGRACISPGRNLFSGGVMTVQGFVVSQVESIEGILTGEVANLARDKGKVSIPKGALMGWAQEQVEIVSGSDMQLLAKLRVAAVALACGATVGNLPIIEYEGDYLNTNELRELLQDWSGPANLFEGTVEWEEDDKCHPKDFDNFEPNSETFFLNNAPVGDWIGYLGYGTHTLSTLFKEILSEQWPNHEENESYGVEIGTVDYQEISRRAQVFERVDEDGQ